MRRPTPAQLTLLGLICLGAVLRLARLGSLPPAIFRDEAEKAYTAWSILRTGRDLTGHFLPIFIEVFQVTTSAIYQYACIPFVALFGLNEWSARLPAVIAALVTILVNYAWMRRSRGTDAATWATVFLVLSPWHITFSRWAQQGIFLPLLLSSAMLCFQLFLTGRRAALSLAAASFALAIYAYDPARLFVPLLMTVLCVAYRRELIAHRLAALSAVVTFALVAAPTAWLIIHTPGAAFARLHAISIFQPGQPWIAAVPVFLGNYVQHFSPAFLLLRGDPEMRHSAGVGVLTLMELIFIVYKLFTPKRREDWVLIAWILLFPVAASMTREGIPHALRSIVAIPAMQDLAGIGVAHFLSRPRIAIRKWAPNAVACLAVVAFLPFAFAYFVTYAKRSAFSWQYGVKQSLEMLEPQMSRLDHVEFYNVTGGEYLVAFYDRIRPEILQQGGFGLTKFHFAPFRYPLEKLYTTGLPVAYVGYMEAQPTGGSMTAITAPGSDEPVMTVALNAAAVSRINR